MSQEPSQRKNGNGSASRAQRSTLLLTNATKLVGLGLAVAEWAKAGPVQDSVLILCGIFVLGVEVVEKVILHAIDRLLGSGGT